MNLKNILYKGVTLSDNKTIVTSGFYRDQDGQEFLIQDGYLIKCVSGSIKPSTGIKDIDGNYIFEGDVLTSSENGNTYTVKLNEQNTKYYLEVSKFSNETNSMDDIVFYALSNENLGNGYYSRKDLKINENNFNL